MIYLCEEENYAKLPFIIKPSHYDISLTVNLSKQEFEGNVVIYIDVLQRTREIQLHSLDLEIENIKLISVHNICIEPERTIFSKKSDLLKLFFNKPVTAGSYHLIIQYEGSLTEDPRGIFIVKYFESSGQEKMTVFTKFEPAYARKCFPCWDEPTFKATFKINITVSSEYTALSNMPVESVEKLGKNRKYHFVISPMMSTHHVTVALGEFTFSEVLTSEGIPVRVNRINEKQEQERFLLHMALNALSFYSKYFNVPYPLPKLDFVACPNYGFDTMGHWGIIIFREINMFIGPLTPVDLAEKCMVLSINHQIAHQWFGNLVTMRCWSQFWFLEAMTQFVEYVCYDYTYPNSQIWQEFVMQFLHTAFYLDESKQSHCIKLTIKTAQEVEMVYDGINYNKGISLTRMLHWYVGDDNFRKALYVYFTTYAWKNAIPENFYSALEEITDIPVLNIMSTWMKQSGFPVVNISIASGCDCKLNRNGITVKLEQFRFTSNNTQKKHEVDETLWKIPIAVTTASNKEIKFLLEDRQLKLFLPDANPDGWILLNPGAVGYYRVQYSPEMITKIASALDKFPVIDRIIVLDDLFHMVKYEYTCIPELMEILSASENNKEFLVWSAISKILSKLVILLSNSSTIDNFNKFQRKLLDKASNALGWNETSKDNRFDNFKRELVLGQKSWLHDEHIMHQGKRLYTDVTESNEKLPNDLNIAFYRAIVKSEGIKKFDALMKLYKSVDIHEERKSLCNDLYKSRNEKLLRKLLTFAICNETDPTNTFLIVMAITYAKTGTDLLWNYYQNYWRDILDKNNKDILGKMLQEIKDKYAGDPMTIQIETFLNKNFPCSRSSLQNVLEILKHKFECVLERDSEVIQKLLSPF